MSNNIVPVNLARADYPLMKVDNKRTWTILKGCSENSYQSFPSSSFNNAQVTIVCNPPSNKNIIDRLIYIRNTYRLVFTGPVQVAPIVQIGTTDAPRCQPIAATTNTVQVSINNDQISTNLNQYWSGLSRYHNTLNNRDEFLSMTPSFQDKSQQYSQLLGSTRNPLGSYSDSADGQILRGGYSNYEIVSSTTTRFEMLLTVTEPLYLSPFLFSGEDNLESGLVGVNNMSIVMTMGDLNRVWSHDSVNGKTITSLVTTLENSMAIFHYLTPSLVAPLPAQQCWPYFEIVSYPTTISKNLANNESYTATMNSIQIKCIPQKIYVFVRKQDSDLNYTTTDTFARINSITMTYGNRTGLLSTAQPENLYQMCLKNGLKMNYEEFRSHVGSVLCIKPGEDIGLDAISAPGMMDNQTLTLSVNITNISGASGNFALYVVVVNAGTISMVNGSFMHQVGVFNSQDVLNLDAAGSATVPYSADNNVYGGGWFDNLKRWLVSARDTIKPYAGPVLDVLEKEYPAVQHGRKLVGLGAGGALVGGRAISKSKLRNRLMNL